MISIRLAAYRSRSRIGAIRIAASTTLGQSQEQQDETIRMLHLDRAADGYNSQISNMPPSWNRRAPRAAEGGAFGAVGGAIGGDAGKGAAAGAGVGGLFAVMRRPEMETQQAQAQSRRAAAAAQRNAGFNRAMAACLLSGSSFLCCGDRARQDAGSQTGGKRGTRASLRCLSRGGATGRPQRARGNPQPSSGPVTEGEQRRRRSLCLSRRTSTPRN
jgi:hypothetical protein